MRLKTLQWTPGRHPSRDYLRIVATTSARGLKKKKQRGFVFHSCSKGKHKALLYRCHAHHSPSGALLAGQRPRFWPECAGLGDGKERRSRRCNQVPGTQLRAPQVSTWDRVFSQKSTPIWIRTKFLTFLDVFHYLFKNKNKNTRYVWGTMTWNNLNQC